MSATRMSILNILHLMAKRRVSEELDLKKFGSRVKKYRQDLKLSQETLGFEAALSTRQIQRIENGSDVYLSTAIKIANALGLELSKLIH